MSLVSDALRKARQSDVRRTVPIPPVLVPVTRRSRLGLGILLGAAIALLAAATGGGIVWGLRGGRGSAAKVATAAPAATAPATGRGAPPRTDARMPNAAAPETGAPRPSVAGPTVETAAPPAVGTSQGTSPAVAATAPPSPATEPPPHAGGAQARGTVEEPTSAAEEPAGEHEAARKRVYILDANLGYAKLHLDYLVYKPSAPFGRINGQDVIVGSVVDGFVVEEIGPDSVTLRDRRGPLVLRVR